MPDLTPQQRIFIGEYLIDRNAKQAAIRAGYSAKTAEQQGSRLLSKVEVQREVNRRLEKLEQKAIITQEEVLNDLKELRDVCMGRKKVTKTVISNIDGAVVPMDVEQVIIDNAGAKGALELLGKHLKMFTDKQETLLTGGINLNVTTGVPDRDA